jgi:hypothetical protein
VQQGVIQPILFLEIRQNMFTGVRDIRGFNWGLDSFRR